MAEAIVSAAGPGNIDPVGRSGTPLLDLKQLQTGTVVRVLAHFDASGDFQYQIKAATEDAKPLTPAGGSVDNKGVVPVTKIAYFEVTGDEGALHELELEVEFTGGSGEWANFLMVGDHIVGFLHD